MSIVYNTVPLATIGLIIYFKSKKMNAERPINLRNHLTILKEKVRNGATDLSKKMDIPDPLVKRYADWLEKASVGALAVGLFQKNEWATAFALSALAASLWFGWRVEDKEGTKCAKKYIPTVVFLAIVSAWVYFLFVTAPEPLQPVVYCYPNP